MILAYLIIVLLIYILLIVRPLKLKESLIALSGVIILLLLNILGIKETFSSLIIFGALEPFKIVIFFLTFAFISTTLDDLGFFEYLATRAIKKSKGNANKLFLYLFILSAIISFFAANDVVILTLTPFIIYMAKYIKLDIEPHLIAMFIVANTSSIAMLSGNPTNLIVANVYNISYLNNLLIMIIPTLAGLLTEYIILKKLFKKELNKKTKLTHKSLNKKFFTNEEGTKIKILLIILALSLIGFSLSHVIGIEIWIISTIAAIAGIIIARLNPIKRISRLPWNVIILMISLFMLLSGFIQLGIIEKIVNYIQPITSTGSFSLAMIVTFVSTGVAGILNNIPSTTILSNIGNSLTFVEPIKRQLVARGILIASNLAANVTILGSLAGIMWYSFIRESKLKIKIWELTKYGIITTIPTIIIMLLILYLELKIFPI